MLRLRHFAPAARPLRRAASSCCGHPEIKREIKVLSQTAVAGGQLTRFSHESSATGTTMTAAVFIPPGTEFDREVPALYWLSGLTCTDENFAQKAGAFNHAARNRVALVVPDTSPRGAGVPGEDDSYDLGTGAGFFIDATAEPWAQHYRMHSYVARELPALVEREFRISADDRSIFGHSMGGHGALTIAFKEADRWVSTSAFAPICNPTQCEWGRKAFGAYLGSVEAGEAHDAAALLRAHGPFEQLGELLIDQAQRAKRPFAAPLQAPSCACRARAELPRLAGRRRRVPARGAAAARGAARGGGGGEHASPAAHRHSHQAPFDAILGVRVAGGPAPHAPHAPRRRPLVLLHLELCRRRDGRCRRVRAYHAGR